MTQLDDIPPGSVDVLFSNWLLMYLDDDELKALAAKAFGWLSPGGSLFFRESCYRRSGSVPRGFNPTRYRHPDEYTEIFRELSGRDAVDGTEYALELELMQPVQTYVEQKGNDGQICWRWSKQPLG